MHVVLLMTTECPHDYYRFDRSYTTGRAFNESAAGPVVALAQYSSRVCFSLGFSADR
jgi:hypothetical protein